MSGAWFAPAKQHLAIPNVSVKKGDALFLPVNIPLSDKAFCRNCQALSKNDRIIYATAELTTVEYENGILAMEFNAPSGGEVILQLTSEPSGPYLAGGKPEKFDWDNVSMRARLPIPAGQGSASRTRIGLALQAPDASAFFVDSQPLVIGQANTVATSYSSPQIAQRSRLVLPPNLKATKIDRRGWRFSAQHQLSRGRACGRGARRSCATRAGSRWHTDGACAPADCCGRHPCVSGKLSHCTTARTANCPPIRL